jgi:AraC family transcriptional regulator, transcriptional activator of pobA
MGQEHRSGEYYLARLRAFIDSHDKLLFPHRHDFYQMVLLTQADGTHSIDFIPFEARAGQLYCMRPGQVHSWHYGPEAEGIILNFNEAFITAICHDPEFLQEFPMFTVETCVLQLDGNALERIGQLMETMLQEYEASPRPYRPDMLRGMLVQVLVEVARCMPEAGEISGSIHQQDMLRRFRQLIERHFKTHRLPKDYAEMLHLTPNHLNAVCKACTGMSAGALIRDRILLEAKRLLVNPQWSIAEIADQLDFKDNAYFSRFFRKYTEQTPEQFRRIGLSDKH